MAVKIQPGQYLTDLCGSPHYLAPELIGQKYRQQVDVWSVGVLMYLMVIGRYPFDGPSPQEVMMAILQTKISYDSKFPLSEPVLTVMQRFLERNPNKRATAEMALQLPIFTGLEKAHAEEPGIIKSPSVIPKDLLVEARKKILQQKLVIDSLKETHRTNLMKKAREDWRKGISEGRRLVQTDVIDELKKQREVVRRDNNIMTETQGGLSEATKRKQQSQKDLGSSATKRLSLHLSSLRSRGSVVSRSRGSVVALLRGPSHTKVEPVVPVAPPVAPAAAGASGAPKTRRMSHMGNVTQSHIAAFKATFDKYKRENESCIVALAAVLTVASVSLEQVPR
eukprot:CAMPEP_0204338368 /NCGR_PEP_ID=MMETSP0469-20131031/21013_1 /ASSEMBLY_ACC=CAM_ASM_000384 /TAXON_ID=2969 /ORGANISM="Oxyrrhis marina" /LENGTH=336 /DNA_ID=CAMNT_0051322533 /DNA_START=18 /DNA_END=1029 /DNA_ORIENTATION=+